MRKLKCILINNFNFMGVNNLNSTDVDNNSSKVTANTENIEEQSLKISELKKEEEKQKSKEQVQAEIMSHFIQNPDENILLSMNISKDSKDGCEIVDFGEAKYEDENLNKLLNGGIIQKFGGVKLKADESGEKGEEFTKELVIDRKTNTKGMLFVCKKGLKLEKFDFEDISKFEATFETYFAYKKNGTTYIKVIKNESLKFTFKTKDGEFSEQMEFGKDELGKLTPEMIQKSQEELITLLKNAKNSGNLNATIDMLLSKLPITEEMKVKFRDEISNMA